MRAKELRKQATPAKKILWKQLRNWRLNGIKFRRQHVPGRFIIDFYRPAHRLVIENDGEFHHEQVNQNRTQALEDYGYKVIRFWNYEVEQNIDTVLDSIIKNL